MRTEFIKQRLLNLGKDIEWLAGKCGVSAVTISHNYMRGMFASKPILMLMATALECEPKDLVSEENWGRYSF